MLRLAVLVLTVTACGGAAMQTVQLVNRTPRTIAEVYLFPAGSANHGASRGSLAPGATLAVAVKGGNVEILAVSEKVQIDDHTRETKQASSTIQLTRPLSLVFHDSDQPPPDLRNKDAIGVAFQNDPAPAPPAPQDPP